MALLNHREGNTTERYSTTLLDLSLQSGTQTLVVPAYRWSFGCSPTSGSMIAAYYDRNGFPDIYTGDTNSGVMPMDNSVWSFWVSGCSQVRYQNPLSASRQGLDGKATEGHVDDYWTCLNSTADDPYLGPPGWPEHAFDSIADFMYSSRSDLGVPDGATSFHSWSNADPLFCSTIEGWGTNDGALGLKEFYEHRGYSVSDCYTQKTDNQYSGGFSFEDFKAEIDAGHPVMLHVEGHTMVGVGYADSNTVYLHDTWDYDTHSMSWGGSYDGMDMLMVSIVHPASPEMDVQGLGHSILDGDITPTIIDGTDFAAADVTAETVIHIFTIENSGDGDLNLDDIPKVAISGTHAGDFTVTSQPASPIASGGGTTTFEITFNPSAPGIREGSISIANNDSNENPYIFSIQGTGVVPEMDLQGGGLSISDGDNSPALADDTDFGSADVDADTVVHTFTIENTGTGDLVLTDTPKVQISGTHAGDFSVTSQPSSPVAASGGTTTFEITFDPSGEGLRTATVSIANNDSDENPYDFAIQGTGTVPITTQPPFADFNGDGDTDFSYYRPSNGYWYSSDDGTPSWTWFGGEPTDIIVPGDYNGDGDTDFAYYRPSNGYWYVKDDGVSSYTWWGAAPTDILVPGDYNGDGDTDFAYDRPSTGFWYIYDDGVGSWTWWGAAPTDILVPGDFNGDGDTDLAYYRPSNGFWYVKDDGIASWEWWGAAPTDILVPGDFNGDGDTDLAYYRPSNGFWYVKDDGIASWEWWGAAPTDVLVPGDFNGDGDTDLAYYRPSNGFWYVKDDGSPSWTWFGALPDDLIIPGDINGDGVPW